MAYFGIALALALMCGCIAERPQEIYPTPSMAPIIQISGTVLDRDGVPVQGARVALWQGDSLVGSPDSIQYSNATGFFKFTGLQPAHYQVTADIQGQKGEVDMRFNGDANIEVTIPGYSVSNVTQGPGRVDEGVPAFTVTRTGPSSVQIRLLSLGNATSVRGFYLASPAIATREIIPADSSLGEKETIEIEDPNLMGTVRVIAYSWVNGKYAMVVNATV